MTHRSLGAFAVLAAMATLAASPSCAATWVTNPAKSQIDFSGQQTGVPFHGHFDRFDASIDFDPAHPEASHIVVAVDLSSAHTGDSQRDTALPGADWFDVARSRTARFETTSIQKAGAESYEAQAKLTIRGQTRAVTLPFTLQISGKTAHAIGHTELLRTAFDVGQGAWASDQWVALQVAVDIDLTATAR